MRNQDLLHLTFKNLPISWEMISGSLCHQTTNPPTASARDHAGNHNFIYSRPSGIPTDFKDTHLHSRFCVLRDCTNRSTSAHVAVSCQSDKELEVNAWRAADAQRKSNRCTKARQSEQEEINNERKLERGHAAAAKLLNNGQVAVQKCLFCTHLFPCTDQICRRGASSINLLCMHKCSFNDVHLVLCCFPSHLFFLSLLLQTHQRFCIFSFKDHHPWETVSSLAENCITIGARGRRSSSGR